MQESNIRKIIVNSSFTIILFSVLIIIILESKLYFNSHLKLLSQSLKSGIETYKVKVDKEAMETKYDISNPLKLSVYDKNPIKVIQKLTNIHEIEKSHGEADEVPKEIESDILEDPLFKGYYIQLGIFTNKTQAEESIKNLQSKEMIDDNFVTYIETKYIQEKPFYLAQIGVFSSKNDAINFCDKLQKKGIGCLIID